MWVTRRFFIICCLLAGIAGVAHGAQVLHAELTRHEGTYWVDIRARIQAPVAAVRRIVTDYEHLTRLNPAIQSSQVLAVYGPRRSRVRTVTRACVLFFCKEIVQVQNVDVLPDGDVVARTVPALSDFKFAVARWHLARQGRSTVMEFSARFAPDFWVPPLIGPWVIRRKLSEEMVQTAQRIEQIAGSGAPVGAVSH